MFTANSGGPIFYGVPTIYITETAARYMKCVVDAVTTEVGWLMVTHQTAKGDFILSECIVPKQECHSATTELVGDGLSELAMEVMQEDQEKGVTDPNDDAFRYNHLNAWFHSHGAGSVGPSGQDDRQMQDFCQLYGDSYDVWVRGIVNKGGDIHLTVYFKAGNTWKAIANCPCEIRYENTSAMESEVKALVRSRVSQIGASYTTPYNSKNLVHRGTTYQPHKYDPTPPSGKKAGRIIVNDRRRVG